MAQVETITQNLPQQVLILLGTIGIAGSNDFQVNISGELLTAGIETHLVAGTPIWVHNVPKTISDCFKYRSAIGQSPGFAIGLDVALEALKEAWMARKLDLNLLANYAQICRIQRVLQPYLEMLVL